jgi:ribonuclease P protein component
MAQMSGPVHDYSFPHALHLKLNADISAVFKHGRNVSTKGARLFFMPTGNNADTRIAFTFSRKFGNAVQRNRARRLGREAFRHLKIHLAHGFDLVLLVYPDNNASFNSRFNQLKTLVSKAHLCAGGVLP